MSEQPPSTPTREWAAAAGGRVQDLSGNALRHNKEMLKNGGFIALGGVGLATEMLKS